MNSIHKAGIVQGRKPAALIYIVAQEFDQLVNVVRLDVDWATGIELW